MEKLNSLKAAAIMMACVLTVSLQACKDDDKDDNEQPEPIVTIKTGVLGYYTGEEIEIIDRNVGATAVNGAGTYMTWDQAITSCPEGYVVLSSADYVELSYDAAYETVATWKAGLKWPFVGHYDGSELKDATGAYYWLSDEDTSDLAFVGRIFSTAKDNAYVDTPGALSKAYKMQVRCQKYYPIP